MIFYCILVDFQITWNIAWQNTCRVYRKTIVDAIYLLMNCRAYFAMYYQTVGSCISKTICIEYFSNENVISTCYIISLYSCTKNIYRIIWMKLYWVVVLIYINKFFNYYHRNLENFRLHFFRKRRKSTKAMLWPYTKKSIA